MTDRVAEQLAQAGAVLSEWYDENMGAPSLGAPPVAMVVPLAPAGRARRSLAFAAASVALVGSVVAISVLANRDARVPVATPGTTVATGAPNPDQLEGTMRLSLGDGQEIEARIYTDGSFCWGLPQQDESFVCGPSDERSDSVPSSQPSIATVGTSDLEFLFGRLPDGATGVRVQLGVDGEVSPSDGSTTQVVGDHWASSMLVPGERVVIAYLSDEGHVVEEFEFDVP
ncbi:MAG: hypothetical protein ACXIVQ_16250 [Acidimicrobiales bacterium]